MTTLYDTRYTNVAAGRNFLTPKKSFFGHNSTKNQNFKNRITAFFGPSLMYIHTKNGRNSLAATLLKTAIPVFLVQKVGMGKLGETLFNNLWFDLLD